MAFEQKRLMLILNNTTERVNSSSIPFESVIHAWHDSLKSFEALVNGVSQKAKNGEILLALSAWHIYPNLMIVKPEPKQMYLKDSLLQSCGVLTVGLHKVDDHLGGISWSLPLSHLRHYEAPVNREGTFNSAQRLTLEEFSQVFLGAFLQGWGAKIVDRSIMIQWLTKIRSILHGLAHQERYPLMQYLNLYGTGCWLNTLFEASTQCLQASNAGDEAFKQMLRLGSQHAKVFLGTSFLRPYFGLSEKGKFVSCAATEDDKVQILRHAAAKLPGEPDQMFIRLRHDTAPPATPLYEYATAKPMKRQSLKRHSDGRQQQALIHQRWLCDGGVLKDHTSDKRYYRHLVKVFPYLASSTNYSSSPWPAEVSSTDISGQGSSLIDRCQSKIRRPLRSDHDASLLVLQANFEERSKYYRELGEEVTRREEQGIEDFEVDKMGIFWPSYSQDVYPESGAFSEMIYGDESAALYAVAGVEHIRQSAEDFSLSHFHQLFESPLLDPKALCETLQEAVDSALFFPAHTNSSYYASLQAISYAAGLFKDLRLATINVRLLEHGLWSSSWISGTPDGCPKSMEEYAKISFCNPQTSTYSQLTLTKSSYATDMLNLYPMNLQQAFACLRFFESGRFLVHPAELKNVMAMSSNDLIFVAPYLLDDPSTAFPPNETSLIKVFPRNIGRSGIAFMIPPVEPLIRPRNILDFRSIVHRPFEGHLHNNFKSTSLHLSFTAAESSVNVGFSGMKDDEVYLLETLRSVHEGGEWVADLDVRESFSLTPNYVIVKQCKEHVESKIDNNLKISCVDNWAELIDPPESRLGAVRACGSWQARLATFTVAIAAENNVVILPESVCWQNVTEMVSSQQLDKKLILIA